VYGVSKVDPIRRGGEEEEEEDRNKVVALLALFRSTAVAWDVFILNCLYF
jgi:hypothetical protein